MIIAFGTFLVLHSASENKPLLFLVGVLFVFIGVTLSSLTSQP